MRTIALCTFLPLIWLLSTFHLRQGLSLNSQFLILFCKSGLFSLPQESLLCHAFLASAWIPGIQTLVLMIAWSIPPISSYSSVWSITLLIYTLFSIVFCMNADTLTVSVSENWKFPILFSSLASTVVVTVFIWVGKWYGYLTAWGATITFLSIILSSSLSFLNLLINPAHKASNIIWWHC